MFHYPLLAMLCFCVCNWKVYHVFHLLSSNLLHRQQKIRIYVVVTLNTNQIIVKSDVSYLCWKILEILCLFDRMSSPERKRLRLDENSCEITEKQVIMLMFVMFLVHIFISDHKSQSQISRSDNRSYISDLKVRFLMPNLRSLITNSDDMMNLSLS